MVRSRAGRFALSRIATAGLVFASGVIAARTLGSADYGRLALAVFIAKLALLGGAGSASGFIYRAFRPREGEAEERHVSPPPAGSYLTYYQFHLITVAGLLFFPAWLLGAPYWYGVLCFLLLSPFFALEPVARVEERYEVSLLPDVVLSLGVLAAGLLPVFTSTSGWLTHWYLLIGLMSPALFLPAALIWYRRIVRRLRTEGDFGLGDYAGFIRDGFPLYAGTAAFVAFQFVDRFSFERFHLPSELGVYMLSFQLAAGGTLLLTALNFVSGVDFGKLIQSGEDVTSVVSSHLTWRGLLAVLSVGTIGGLAWVLETYLLEGYPGLTLVSLTLGVGLSLFHWAGSVTSVAFYHRRQLPLTWGMVVLLVLAIGHNALVVGMGLPAFTVPALSGLWLSMYALFAVWHVVRVSRSGSGPVKR